MSKPVLMGLVGLDDTGGRVAWAERRGGRWLITGCLGGGCEVTTETEARTVLQSLGATTISEEVGFFAKVDWRSEGGDA